MPYLPNLFKYPIVAFVLFAYLIIGYSFIKAILHDDPKFNTTPQTPPIKSKSYKPILSQSISQSIPQKLFKSILL
jgi:hypothetical protein